MNHQQPVAGLLLTMTTYGTWLRGDDRGWVEHGQIRDAAPQLKAHDAALLKHAPFEFDPSQLNIVGDALGRALIDRIDQRVLALTVQTWHLHFVVAGSDVPVSIVVKCAKDAVRYALRLGRPIWTDGYDKRLCFGSDSLLARINYVERHNIRNGLHARPWPFTEPFDSR